MRPGASFREGLPLSLRTALAHLTARRPDLTFDVEWFDPDDDKTHRGDVVAGGATRTLISPFRGYAVLVLERVGK